ncbi:hypothetical protein CROQUDRAFT_43402 [Cronartium quercuum f. sp. fusiforme G11]|uniref:Ankyrin n=1 Tax=Cronartium quercuum f. sp. fusiforme G11 TaxID=708437 RepID=A0A9P6NHI4_9BASI|nr:hypothetical protein CROQUDRAFT_43402 [Cronartium quercuum f. sp. fusiforme G11]
MATANGHLEVVKYILEHLPDKRALLRPNNPPAKNTPLHWAAMNHHLGILKLLCPRLTCQDISILNGRGWSAMSEAVEGIGLSSVDDVGPEKIPIREQCVNYLVEMMKLGADEEEGDMSPELAPEVIKPVEEGVHKLRLDDKPPVCLR